MASMIFAVANQKGGVGKTTLTLNLAGAVCDQYLRNKKDGDEEFRVLVIDADPQNTSMRSAGVAKVELPFSVISLAGRVDMGREIQKLAAGYDVVFIDCPPAKEGRATERAMRVADFVLIPLDASAADLWSTAGMLEEFPNLAGEIDPNKAAIVFNKTNKRLKSFGTTKKVLTTASPFRILQTVIPQREIYRTCMATGTTVFTIKGERRAREAQEEIHAVLEEALQVMHRLEEPSNAA
ncbi:AAA family ATPase [Paraburkholderia youngii]|uniref:AAA family ATPase n=1 Tax=Paraburkholderia youngii TaxID=2782701 RepID=UPI003D203417